MVLKFVFISPLKRDKERFYLVFLSVSMNLLAIPMSLFDLSVGYIYPIPYAFLTLILVRFLSAAGSFVIAKYMCAECAKNTFIKKKEVKSDS